jgi:membrane associated rhomboid family serine protease
VVYYRYQQPTIRFGPELTPIVKLLMIANGSIFVITYLLAALADIYVVAWLGLRPYDVTRSLHIWQLGTYLFLHGGFFHILFNMFALWMFGSDLEKSWGSEKFLFYYFLTGIGAGLCDVLVHPSATSVTIGASGAVYGLLLAFGMTYPDRPILIYFVIPIKAKYFVMIIGGIAFLSAVGSSGSGISHIAHLGGMIFGYLYLRRGTLFRSRLRYHEWREARRRKKFKVYMEKISREDPDRWVN